MRTAGFLEIHNMNLERNHVVFVAILFSCQGTDVRERAAILPDPHVRVKRLSSTSRGANPSDADTLTARICCWKRSAGPNYLAACRDRGVYVPVAPLSTTSFDARPRRRSMLPCRGSWTTRPPSPLFQLVLLHNLLCRFELWPVFQRSRTAQGPAVTTLPQVLFHRFRYSARRRETDVTRRQVEPLSPPRGDAPHR
jgi:hypothetical protein